MSDVLAQKLMTGENGLEFRKELLRFWFCRDGDVRGYILNEKKLTYDEFVGKVVNHSDFDKIYQGAGKTSSASYDNLKVPGGAFNSYVLSKDCYWPVINDVIQLDCDAKKLEQWANSQVFKQCIKNRTDRMRGKAGHFVYRVNSSQYKNWVRERFGIDMNSWIGSYRPAHTLTFNEFLNRLNQKLEQLEPSFESIVSIVKETH